MTNKYKNYLRQISFNPAVYLTQAQGVVNDFFKRVGKDLFGSNPDPKVAATSPAGARNIGELIFFVVNILLLVAASIAVIFLIVGGYKYIVAHGNEEAAEEAKKTIKGAIIGLIVIVLAFAIVNIIISILLKGVPGTGIQGP